MTYMGTAARKRLMATEYNFTFRPKKYHKMFFIHAVFIPLY